MVKKTCKIFQVYQLYWEPSWLNIVLGGFKEFWDVYKDDSSLFGVHGYLAMLDNEKELNEVRKLRRKNKSLPVSYRAFPKK